MFITEPEGFLTLASDPGEDAGWSLWNGPLLVSRGTMKLWQFADEAFLAVKTTKPRSELRHPGYAREGMEQYLDLPVKRIVCEDFRLYPDKARALAWDPMRTNRLVGALTFIARLANIEFTIQPALIKERATAGGAAEFFDRPVHENRHQNDSIMHGWYYMQMGPDGDPRVQGRISADEEKARHAS